MEENNSSVGGFQVFDNPEAMIASDQPQQETQQEAPPQESQPVQEPTQESAPAPQEPVQEQETQPQQAEQNYTQQEYSQEDIEEAVLSYASERLGRQISSFDDLEGTQQEQAAIDERVAKIAEFVETTGRSPEDWFRYQSLNPSEMDDLTAVRVSLAADYPNLSSNEINLLVNNTYKLDAEKHDAEQVQLSQLQLKIDAEKARNGIAEIRNKYTAPAPSRQEDVEPIFNEDWLSNMSEQVDTIEGLEFDLGNDKSFTFGLGEEQISRIKDSNARLEEFFDPFIMEDGSWDVDALSSHIAVTQNIDQIVSAAYKQGVGDGQRGLVDRAANVSTASPNQGGTMNESNPLSDQVRNIMRGTSSGLTFKI